MMSPFWNCSDSSLLSSAVSVTDRFDRGMLAGHDVLVDWILEVSAIAGNNVLTKEVGQVDRIGIGKANCGKLFRFLRLVVADREHEQPRLGLGNGRWFDVRRRDVDEINRFSSFMTVFVGRHHFQTSPPLGSEFDLYKVVESRFHFIQRG